MADDEFDRIRALTQCFALQSTAVQLGIGDDAAVLRPQPHPTVLSVDVAVQGIHFEPRFASYREIGARAFTAAVSDLGAMGSTPLGALCSLIVPSDLSRSDFDALNAGLAEAAAHYACPVIGGNLSSGSTLSITTTVVGKLEGPGLYRAGARAGDSVYVTGALGSAALGLRLLQLGAAARGPGFVAAFRAPHARIAQGQKLAGVATSAVDVSDGALQDLGHICEASQLGAQLEAARLPLAEGMAELALAIGEDPVKLALLGGDDYELIYTLPAGATDPCGGTCIGRMLSAAGVVSVLDERGQPMALGGRGYRHF
jgi:thiamine-monophosphate kinase